jgi:hypothetical protein
MMFSTAGATGTAGSLPRLRARGGEGAAFRLFACRTPPPCPSPASGGGDVSGTGTAKHRARGIL